MDRSGPFAIKRSYICTVKHIRTRSKCKRPARRRAGRVANVNYCFERKLGFLKSRRSSGSVGESCSCLRNPAPVCASPPALFRSAPGPQHPGGGEEYLSYVQWQLKGDGPLFGNGEDHDAVPVVGVVNLSVAAGCFEHETGGIDAVVTYEDVGNSLGATL